MKRLFLLACVTLLSTTYACAPQPGVHLLVIGDHQPALPRGDDLHGTEGKTPRPPKGAKGPPLVSAAERLGRVFDHV